MAADHPLAGRASVSLQDLGAYPMALTEPGTTTRRLFELGCALESVQIEPALSCNDPRRCMASCTAPTPSCWAAISR